MQSLVDKYSNRPSTKQRHHNHHKTKCVVAQASSSVQDKNIISQTTSAVQRGTQMRDELSRVPGSSLAQISNALHSVSVSKV